MASSQQQLDLPIDGAVPEGFLRLELKPYIQPFERVLASAELTGLFPSLELGFPWEQETPDLVELCSDVPVEHLRQRLAYWQRVGHNILEPSVQAILEATDGPNSGESLPNGRKLRYGPHDLHEYRGKFFPQLVRSLINFAGLTDDSLILDPTCGSGTTNCEARVIGMRSVGLDLNPLSSLIAQVKSSIVGLDVDEFQTDVKTALQRVKRMKATEPSNLWVKNDLEYLKRWFAPEALREVAAIRGAIDRHASESIRDFLKLCLSNIVRKVSWQKESDLRVRKEIFQYQATFALSRFVAEVERQTGKIIPYLESLREQNVPVHPKMADIRVGDARRIHEELPEYRGQCDLLITSPPYATALPYIDTDRLSLIVLGLLKRTEQRHREKDMIGNREVTERERVMLWREYLDRRKELPKPVLDLIDGVAAQNHMEGVGFRRRNTPALLGKYFLDMIVSLRNAKRMMKPGSYACYVIGNNSTRVNGERLEIPTDEFLCLLAKREGWYHVAELPMELLPSRDIFRNNRGSSEKVLILRSTVERKSVFSVALNADKNKRDESWDFTDADTREHLHTLHPYPARFIPQIPRRAILEFSNPGDMVLDPFSGGGTTVLEAILACRNAIGVDNNAVAHLIAEAKVANYSAKDLKCLNTFFSELDYLVKSAPDDCWKPSYKNIDYWFSDDSIEDLSRLRWTIHTLPKRPRLLALSVFSSIIIRSSRQDSETRYKRTERQYISGNAVRLFAQRLIEATKRARRILSGPRGKASLVLADSKRLEFIGDRSIDFIVTSPPYLNAYDYHKYHRHRLHWIGGDVQLARDAEIGKHDTFTRRGATPDKYFEDMYVCFEEWKRVLRMGGRVMIVIGDAIVSGNAVPVADRFIYLMEDLNFELEDHILRAVKAAQKSFGPGARANMEHLLLFVKK